MEEQTAFQERTGVWNECEHVSLVTPRVSCGSRSNLESGLLEFARRSWHVPCMGDKRDLADTLFLQDGKALVGVFPGIARCLLHPLDWNEKLLFQHCLHL